ncbi:hypothetical protein DSO57_1027213 [Entomophthora muscae]|uniref:Uncharacterized protein n=1 Tax=Entomophthora muscae TaxID=34485 RepID=A0ACC2UMV7_9FUNG|nr:hypothetical protein DSO57_1027213 [Entomophthora muscae]
MVQTLSKVQASQEATKEVFKLYACQLLDNAPDTEPQHLGNATSLRGVNVAIPMETMKDHHPELCDMQAIIKTGAPINIVFSKLVQKMGLTPDIDHKKQYGTAGLDCTTTQGAYSTLPLRFGSLASLPQL